MIPQQIWLPGFADARGGSLFYSWDTLLFERSWSSFASQRKQLEAFMVKAAANGRKAKATGKVEAGSQFTVFVNVRLPIDLDAEVLKVYGKADEVFLGLVTLIETGYRVGFSYDFQRGSTICSLTCRNEESVNLGKTMTSFAGDWYKALQVSLYKHFVYLESDWTGRGEGEDRPAFG